VLVLGALDRAEHLLGLDDAQDLRAGVGEQIAIGLGERRVAVGGEDAAQVAVLDQRHRDQRHAGAPTLVVGQLAGLGRRAQQRLAIAHHRAEDPGRRQARGLGDVVGVGRDLLELDALAVVVEPEQRDRGGAERALERGEHPARGVTDHADAADREQALLLVAAARRPAAGPQRRGDQPVVARRVAQREQLVVEPRRAPPAVARGQAAQQQHVRGRGAEQVRNVDPRGQHRRLGDPRAGQQRRLEQQRHDQRRDRAGSRQHGHRERDEAVEQRVRWRAEPAGHRDHHVDAGDQGERELEVGQVARRGEPERDPLRAGRGRRELHPPDHRDRDQAGHRDDDHRHRQARVAGQDGGAVRPARGDHRTGEPAGDRTDRDLDRAAQRARQVDHGASCGASAAGAGRRSTISSG
jgi:hypothetical protein